MAKLRNTNNTLTRPNTRSNTTTACNQNTTLYLQLLALSLALLAFNVIYHEKVVKHHIVEQSVAHGKQLLEHSTRVATGPIPRSVDVDVEMNADAHEVAGLSCGKYNDNDNGASVSDEFATKEMVYWNDIPSDSNFVSPFYDPSRERYLTFEPDGGGWNNIRMAMETVIVMAHAMGRTLVLPPEKRMYLIGKGDNKQKFKFTFNDFFHLDSIHSEHDGFNMITMEVFLSREAMTGRMVNVTSGEVAFPPGNRTNWDGEDLKPLWEYLRETTDVRNWQPDHCLAAFPSQPGAEDTSRLKEVFETVKRDSSSLSFPVPVDGKLSDRLKESKTRRAQLCLYDEKMQESSVVHFMCYHKQRARLLTHFYLFIFFEDWEQDIWSKRFVRDHIRYRDEIMCAAARIVKAVRDRAKTKDPTSNPDGLYDSMHIRRGDFQFKQTRVEINVIYDQIKKTLKPGGTLYIATDERNKSFFDLLKEHYDVCFLDDFKHLIKGMNTNYYGMLDQLVATKGDIFFGTYFSTLTGYIMRMRGYFSTKLKQDGYMRGDLKNAYYIYPASYRSVMTQYVPPSGNNWEREFPISWRDIDKDTL